MLRHARMFTFVHNESGNVNRAALGSKTTNLIEPCVDNIRREKESLNYTAYFINIKDFSGAWLEFACNHQAVFQYKEIVNYRVIIMLKSIKQFF